MPRGGESHAERGVVAVVGRPNVGKSTLFNKLVGRSLALVDSVPGVTRDRREGSASLGDLEFTVVDTAGLDKPLKKAALGTARGAEAEARAMEEVMEDKGVLDAMLEQTRAAVAAASVVAFVVDVRDGISPWDEYYARWLRKEMAKAGNASPHLLLLANKADGSVADELMLTDELENGWSAHAARRLGFGDPIYLSAEHGDGLATLYTALAPILPSPPEEEQPAPADQAGDQPSSFRVTDPFSDPVSAEERERRERHARSGIRVAIVGRPNVGKSTLANNLLGDERFIVGDMPGVTQDANEVHTVWPVPSSHAHLESLGATPPVETVDVTLVDTAGMMKPSAAAKTSTPKRLASLAFHDAQRAIRKANVVVLVTDIKTSVRGDGKHNPHDPSRSLSAKARARARSKAKKRAAAAAAAAASGELDDEMAGMGELDIDAKDAAQVAYDFEFDSEQTVFSSMDAQIVRTVAEEGRGLVIGINKWDLLGKHGLAVSKENPDSQLGPIVKHLMSKLHFLTPYTLRGTPWVGMSALASMGVDPEVSEPSSFTDLASPAQLSPRSLLVPEILSVYDGWNTRLPTAGLNKWLDSLIINRSPPGKVRYITQVDSRPPKFVLFAAKRGTSSNWASWLKYVTNELRSQFGLYGVPIRISLKHSS